jgi:hypothetical protein
VARQLHAALHRGREILGEIGHANGSKGSLDTDNVRGVAQIRFLPDGTLVAADGYGNHRVSEWDPKTGKNIRIWGAYGKPPSDDPIPHYNVNSPQFGNPVHCAQPSVDGCSMSATAPTTASRPSSSMEPM